MCSPNARKGVLFLLWLLCFAGAAAGFLVHPVFFVILFVCLLYCIIYIYCCKAVKTEIEPNQSAIGDQAIVDMEQLEQAYIESTQNEGIRRNGEHVNPSYSSDGDSINATTSSDDLPRYKDLHP